MNSSEQELGESGAAQTPIADLARGAREHYEHVSTVAHEWSSVIPQAIDVWEREQHGSDASTREQVRLLLAPMIVKSETQPEISDGDVWATFRGTTLVRRIAAFIDERVGVAAELARSRCNCPNCPAKHQMITETH